MLNWHSLCWERNLQLADSKSALEQMTLAGKWEGMQRKSSTVVWKNKSDFLSFLKGQHKDPLLVYYSARITYDICKWNCFMDIFLKTIYLISSQALIFRSLDSVIDLLMGFGAKKVPSPTRKAQYTKSEHVSGCVKMAEAPWQMVKRSPPAQMVVEVNRTRNWSSIRGSFFRFQWKYRWVTLGRHTQTCYFYLQVHTGHAMSIWVRWESK